MAEFGCKKQWVAVSPVPVECCFARKYAYVKMQRALCGCAWKVAKIHLSLRAGGGTERGWWPQEGLPDWPPRPGVLLGAHGHCTYSRAWAPPVAVGRVQGWESRAQPGTRPQKLFCITAALAAIDFRYWFGDPQNTVSPPNALSETGIEMHSVDAVPILADSVKSAQSSEPFWCFHQSVWFLVLGIYCRED